MATGYGNGVPEYVCFSPNQRPSTETCRLGGISRGLPPDLAHARIERMLAGFDVPAGDVPMRLVGRADHEYAVLVVDEERARGGAYGGEGWMGHAVTIARVAQNPVRDDFPTRIRSTPVRRRAAQALTEVTR
jgi:hypothetical protein